MKYFTKELWIALQQSGEAGDEASRRWNEAFAAYARELGTLRDRVSPEVFAFFDQADVHDGSLIQLRLRDFDPLAPKPVPTPEDGDAAEDAADGQPWEGPWRLEVELSVAEWTGVEWTLRYAGIRRFLLDFPTDSPLFFHPGDGFEDWGYHELSDAGDGFLRHEVLFSSGAIVLVECRDIAVTGFDRAGSTQASTQAAPDGPVPDEPAKGSDAVPR